MRAARATRALTVASLVAAVTSPRSLVAQTPTDDATSSTVAAHVLADTGTTPPPATARPDPASTMLTDGGTFVYDLVAAESDNVRSAIEATVAHMSFIARPIARRRLLKANRPPPHLTFDLRADTIAVTFDGLNPIVTPRTGEAVGWIRGQTGERYDVRIAQAGDTLRQVIATDDGQRENCFVFLDGGARIELYVTLTADRLPRPLRYSLMFRRSS